MAIGVDGAAGYVVKNFERQEHDDFESRILKTSEADIKRETFVHIEDKKAAVNEIGCFSSINGQFNAIEGIPGNMGNSIFTPYGRYQ